MYGVLYMLVKLSTSNLLINN